MGEKQKKEKGITLIALVVTIVVLLILAGVAISMLTGDNGIITNAQNAKESMDIAGEKEIVQLSATAAKDLETRIIKEDELRKELNNHADGIELDRVGDKFKVTFPSNRSYIVDGTGKVTEVDRENTIELVAKLAYDGNYYIGVGFANYQVSNDWKDYEDYLEDIVQEKNQNEKEELFIYAENTIEGTNYTNIEDIFSYFFAQGYTDKLVTSLEELVDEWRYNNIDELIADELGRKGYLYDDYEKYMENNIVSGILTTPNGEEIWLTTQNINYKTEDLFDKYCYLYEISQNGEYNFSFVGDDGSYGETTIIVDDTHPQIISLSRHFDSPNLALIAGLDNFVDIERVRIDAVDIKSDNNNILDLTSYIYNGMISFNDVPELSNSWFDWEIVVDYQGKELKRKGSSDLRVQ